MSSDGGTPPLTLSASSRDGEDAALLPEQRVIFDVVLRNDGGEPAEGLDLTSNQDTPVARAFDGNGRQLFSATHGAMTDRIAGDLGDEEPEPPVTITLAPGQTHETFFDLWTYTDPLPRGVYTFGIRHRAAADANAWLESNRVRFEIVDAAVGEVVVGFEDARHESSIVTWSAAPATGGAPRWLARLSATDDHRCAQWSGTPLGEITPSTRLAIGAKPPEGTRTDHGWLAATADDAVELVYHFRTDPQWRSERLALGLRDARPVHGFPDRGHAVFMATGRTPEGGAALTGVPVAAKRAPTAPWVVALTEAPTRAAVSFDAASPFALLLAAEDGATSRLWRLDVDERGGVTGRERLVWASARVILAIGVDQRPRAARSFFALVADPLRRKHLTLVRIAVDGGVDTQEIVALPGWPRENGVPRGVVQADAAIGWNGVPALAFLDEAGDLHGGTLDARGLRRLARSDERALVHPHVVAMQPGPAYAAFTPGGSMVHFGQR
jgi:hypothetical protein